jgi:hypothetical protein
VAFDGAGNFVIVWDSDGQEADVLGVYGQYFDAAGTRVGSEFQVNSTATGSRPSVALDGPGNALIVWDGTSSDDADGGIFGQYYDNTRIPVGGELWLNSTARTVRISAITVGHYDRLASGDGVSRTAFQETGNILGHLIDSSLA